MASKPLYDYFMPLFRAVGVSFLSLDPNSFSVYHLNTRWGNIKRHLSEIEDPKNWDSLIKKANAIRQRVEHDDYHDPNARILRKVRQEAPKFKEWILRVAGEYYKASKNFTFKHSFYRTIDWYLRLADMIFHEFGDNPPHVTTATHLSLTGKQPYEELKALSKVLRRRLSKISTDEDLDRSDLNNLLTLVEIISEISTKEHMLLIQEVCPKCGGKIVESERAFGYEDSGGINYRVGCEKCDYEVHSETFQI